MNDYIDYNNEEVSRYEKKPDPRELNVVQRIKELKDYKPPVIQDDTVSLNQMIVTQTTILQASDQEDQQISDKIEDVKNEIDDDIICFKK